LPSIDEQKIIIEIVGHLLEKESTVLKVINEEYSRLKFLKQSILLKAFKGELGTNDSTDEPAIELVKMILQQKL
jgi:type I restriction enzyme S subunit